MPMISALTICWPRNTIGRPRDQLLQLGERDERARRTRSRRSAPRGRSRRPRRSSRPPAKRWNSASAISAAAPPPTPLNRATICGIAVIFTVRAPTRPTAPPIAIADRDQAVVAEAVLGERDDDRERHSGRADPVALARVLRRREEAEREDEGHDRDQVERVSRRSTHASAPFRLNICSIRSVTTKPPTTFAEREHDRDEPDDLREGVVGGAGDQDRARRSRFRGWRSCPTSAACAASSAPSRSPRCRGRSPGRGSSARARTTLLCRHLLGRTRDAGAARDLVVEVERELAARSEVLQQGADVARVQPAGVGGHQRGEVREADDRDALADDLLARVR